LTVNSSPSNPLLPDPERRERQHVSEEQRMATLESLRRGPIDSLRQGLLVGSPPSANGSCFEDDDPSQLLTQPPDVLGPSLLHMPSPSTPVDDADYIPPNDSDYPPVPPDIYNAILLMLSSVWNIENPREYQVKAIFYMVFLRVRMLYLIRKTGEGKSLVLLGMATMLRGVTVCLVPLLGLGSSQASKSRSKEHRVEGYHVDEYRDQDFDLLSRQMRLYSRTERSSIIVYISPQNLKQGSRCCRLLNDMAAAGYISSICVDEAHATVEQCESFRPEFKDAINSIKNLLSISKTHHPNIDIPMLVMSATFRIPEHMTFNRLVGSTPELVMWGPMDRPLLEYLLESMANHYPISSTHG
jgi:superfamily II DNA helicase RecQ